MAHPTVIEKRSLMAGGRDGQGLNCNWGGSGPGDRLCSCFGFQNPAI